MKKLLKVGEMVDTGCERFPKLHLVKTNGEYGVMVLMRENGRANGWLCGTVGSLKECRDYARRF